MDVYEQEEGLAIESTLSPVLAHVYMYTLKKWH